MIMTPKEISEKAISKLKLYGIHLNESEANEAKNWLVHQINCAKRFKEMKVAVNWTSEFLHTQEECKMEPIKQVYLVTEIEPDTQPIPKKLQKRFAKEQCKKGWKK